MEALEIVNKTYHIENIDADGSSWYDFWTITPPISCNQIAELTLWDLLDYTEFYPTIKKIIKTLKSIMRKYLKNSAYVTIFLRKTARNFRENLA